MDLPMDPETTRKRHGKNWRGNQPRGENERQSANPQNPDAYRPHTMRYGAQTGAVPKQNFHGNVNTSNKSKRRKNFGKPNFDRRDDRLNFRSPNFEKQQNNRRKFQVGFKIIEEWSQKDPDAVVVEIIAKVGEFQELLESEKIQNSDHGDYIVLIVIILAKACQSPFKENKHQIMGLASTEQFINSLTTYIMTLQLQEEDDKRWCKKFWKNPEDFFRNLVIIFETILETIPTKACQILPRLLKGTVCAITALNAGLEDVQGEFLKLQKKLDLSKTEIERKKTRPKHEAVEEAPPDDFRTLSVYPTSQDILSDQRPFIRKHIIEGCYNDVDHYLDVQFCLLKEDFVAPLREGVRQLMDQEASRKRLANVRVHRHVEFKYMKFNQGEVGVVLQFDCRKKREKGHFKFSKRFMYGSLLCFTKDGFMTILFGKVVKRDVKMLEEGQIVVGFEPGYDNYEANTPYVMIECSVYFEPYYHVLRALQNMHEDGFPMKNYLIDVNPAIEPPKYLNHLSRYTVYSSNSSYPVPIPRVVPVLDFTQWLSAEDLSLNPTQREAFWAALTQEFAVIQGPPGTGKTFLGLKIARTLIQNKATWYNHTPILVVCYTNHALDQFLEGLIGTTDEIVRVGGQSKNPKLEKFHLKEKRKVVHSRTGMNRALYNLHSTHREQLTRIHSINETIDEISRYDSVLHFKHFKGIARDFDASWFARASEQALLGWLLGGRTRQQRQQELLLRKMEELEQRNGNTAAATPGQDDNIEFDQMLNEESRARNEIDEDDLLDVIVARNYKPVLLTSIKAMKGRIMEILNDLQILIVELDERVFFDKKWDLERELYETEDDLEYLQMRLFNGQNMQVTRKPRDIDLRNPQNMHPDDRWNLYFYWLNIYRQTLINKHVQLQTLYRDKHRQYMELKCIDDANIMKNMLVVGMTTTGAARLQATLQAIKSPIVIVEEAAEVLESHIIVSLTNHCEHLILIGDHKQLKPSTANYQIEKQFNLGISLFERMVRNEIQCYVLGVQHRMRPEIAKLIVPSVYPTLENHPSVSNFPAVMGVDPCLYFINHKEAELEINDFSKMNQHEAEFLIRLAQYLIQNGYEPEDITILAAYSGQMFALWKERKKYDLLLHDVRITVLDNYQGEESKIILLSLVRNNDADSIGFLSIENRVCVALSRAKEGFYMMGNMDLLSRNSEIWPKVKTALQDQDFLGDSLALRCQIHHEEVTRVKTIKDFDKVPEGGCSKECGFTLNCGHQCPKICHVVDREHAQVKCKAPCIKILCDNNHQCPKLCYEPCGECVVPVKQTLACGHEQHVPCYMDLKDFKCRVQVTATLPCEHVVTNKFCFIKEEHFICPRSCDTRVEPCGHQCVFRCHIKDDPDHLNYTCLKKCARPRRGCSTGEHLCPYRCFEECPPCEVIVKKRGKKCNHMFDVRCSVDVDTVQCPKPCKKALPCGHFCKKTCYEPCNNCQAMLDKEHPICGHKVKSKCSEPPNRKNCRYRCPLLLQCGHPCKNKCNEPCTEKCKELVDHNKPADCGHRFKISCHLQNQNIPSNSNKLLNFCTEPCRTQLSCDHYCKGTCGQCFQGRLHQTCKEKCPVVLIFGHPCPTTCREACQPCSYRCSHSKCKKLCGEPCTSCKQPCLRRCRHVQCTKRCGEVCSVPPCIKPCQKPLKKCGHPCVGFCGDPCPPLCRICDEKELTDPEVPFGYEDEEGAKFVYLQECKHVIVSRAMDEWLQQDDESEITYKSCPRCKTPLTSTQRYSDYIKKANIDVAKVKRRYFGNDKENENNRRQLLEKMHKLRLASKDLMDCENWRANRPQGENWRQPQNPDSYRSPFIRYGVQNGAIPRRNFPGDFNAPRDQRRQNDNFDRRRPNFDSRDDRLNSRRPNFEKKQQNNERKFEVGFKILDDWSQKDPDAIVMEIIGHVAEFQELLESEKIQKSDHGNYIVLIAIILAKACQSPFKENKHQIISLASTAQFINSLTNYIMRLQLQEEEDKRRCQKFWKDPEDFFRNLVIISETILDTIPTKACEILPKLLNGSLCTITALNAGLENVRGEFMKLQKQLDLSKAELERKKTKPKHVEEAPPDDFRTLSVYPTTQDILGDQRPFIRKHIIEGCYDNVDHYLDVQFRLLKEDFVAPLREGVRQVLDQEGQRKRLANVRVHRHVEFRNPTFSQGEVGVVLQFDSRKKREQGNFKFSKRFMYGSLLCFTKDHFSTILFGKVIERDDIMLEEGRVAVAFERGYDNYEANTPYIMIECSVYFEPYYHVLQALQNMHEDDFPMKNYLIDVNPAIEPPKYLNHRSRYIVYSSNSSYLVRVRRVVPVLDFTQWLSAEDLNLNSSQREAFWAALTQQFAVIQGPPGTGKTFLGLKIARTLIQNSAYWYDETPILVVCYTNHALDQFLEGLIDTTNEIVRVGGQSKNPRLEEFHLKEKRKDIHSSTGMSKALSYMYSTLREQLSEIHSISESIDELSRYDSVLHFKHFKDIVWDFGASWFATASEQALLDWLFGGRTRQQHQQEMFARKMEELEQGNGNTAAATAGQDDNIEFDRMLNEESRARNEIDEDDDLLDVIINQNAKHVLLTSIMAMNRRIEEILTELQKLSGELHERAIFDKRWDLERELYETEDDLEYLKMRLFNGQNTQVTRKPPNIDLRNPQNMHPDDRWNLYFFWLNCYRQTLINRLMKLRTLYRYKYRRYKEIRDIDDANIMKNMLVVGMTTTGAARLQATLQAIKSPIVIVEEAAEVLESHIIVSLTKHCKHLILIGDHKQLKPSTANYQIEKQFNLGISLFERMVRNKIQCHVLGVQHRMRPEIAKLIVPSVYPTLENHPSVFDFPAVMGVDPCLYFIDHNEAELELNDFSKMNQHEAEFLIRLAQYLIQNGYEPEDITILAAYSGQMFALWREHKKYDLLRDVRVTVLDNYQGEESKIILLSLVRNNDADSIGFLSIENRVCVALSRAKEGFYMMGNMDLLTRNSEIWPKVKTALQEQDFLGDSLALRCQIHREEVTRVKTIKDFDKVPEGGCSKECESTLHCGHKCPKICHTLDREHAKVECQVPCIRILCGNNHQCPKLCFEPCGECVVPMKQTLACGHEQHVPCHMDLKNFKCRVQVTATLPCEHVVTNKFCSIKEENVTCPFPCDTQIEPCGHQWCVYTCHIKDDPDHLNYKCRKECARPRRGCSTGEHICPNPCFEECEPCEVIVKKRGKKCNHMFDVRCSVDVDTVQCPKPCKKALPCGHFCKKKCYEPCDNCQEMVDKEHPVCGHKVKSKCSEPADRKNCSGPCSFLLQCGHPCKNKCNELCTEECKELVDHNKSANCGHKFKISCHLQNQNILSNSNELLNFCTEPCRTQLSCGHYCKGTCGQCFQGRLHQTCKEKCPVVLICGHPCPITCREACQPCNRPCSYRCSHSKCKKLCGEPCTSCEQPCLRRCQHVQCKNICGEVCSVPPCTEPCQKPLKTCGHPCVGFCGDPCPPLCRICDEKELTEVFRGFEDEEDARFVYLQECKHVIESKGMDAWLQKDESEITYKSCPKCKTPLTSTHRYSDYIKKANIDVSKVKSKYYGNDEQNENKRRQLVEKMHKLRSASEDLMEDSFYMRKFLSNCLQSLLPANRQRRQHLSRTVADVYEIKLRIVEQMVETLNDVKNKMRESTDSDTIFVLSDADLRTEQMEYLNTAIKHFKINLKFLLQNEQRITNQEIADLEREQKRLQRITQLCHLQSSPSLRTQQHKPEVKALVEECNKLVHAASIYTDDQDAAVKEKLVKLSETVKAGIDITDAEKREIDRVINMGAGHWYKCPNGHIYASGDCDEAMQIGKCNECEVQLIDC